MPPNTHLPPTVLRTWIQVCTLSRDGSGMPPIDAHKLAALTGKNEATLSRHISLLRQHGMLDNHLPDKGMKMTIEPHHPVNPPASPPDRCKYPPPTEYTSYFPSRILGYISYDDETETR